MANKNRNLIIAYFPGSEAAESAAKDLKAWDKATKGVKLGGIGVMTVDEEGKLKTRKVGARAGGTGAKWGTILGVTAGILSGGVTVIGGAVVGLAAGSVAGALFHKHIGMDDDEKERLTQHLQDGGAALAVMADDDEVDPAKDQLITLGGSVGSYSVPDETVDELEAAADDANVEEADEAVLAAEGEDAKQAIIHYQRYDGDYDGWGLHVWTGYEGEVTWEEPIQLSGTDEFGIYFAVPTAEGAEELAYIIHKGDEKDLSDDQVLDFANDGYEVWVVQNSPGYVSAPGSETDEEAADSGSSNEGEEASDEEGS